MKTPLNIEEQLSEEWARLKDYVAFTTSENVSVNNFEKNVVTKLLLTSLNVKVPENFEDEVMRRIATENQPIQPNNWEQIISTLKSKTVTIIGVIALVTGGSISIYTINNSPKVYIAPLLPTTNDSGIDLSPVQVERDSRFDNANQVNKNKGNLLQQDSSKHPIPGKPTPNLHVEPQEDF